jgi:hypothetical protein
MSYLITFLIVAAVIIALKYVQIVPIWLKLLKQRFWFTPPALSATDIPPAELSEVYKAAAQTLGEQGFVYSHSLNCTGIFSGKIDLVQVYVHTAKRSYALVSPRKIGRAHV